MLCFRNAAKYILNSKWYESKSENIQEETARIIKTAANLLMAEIREQMYDTSLYPSQEDISANTSLPSGMKSFLEILVKNDLKQESIGQAILYASKPRSFIPPVLFGLGVEVDHLFGSRWLIDELNRLGFSVSYSEVLRFKQSAVKEDDTSKTFETLVPGTFTQFVGDNVDHNLNTLDGKGTFHGMGILAASTNKHEIQRMRRSHIKRQKLDRGTDFLLDKGVKIVPYNITSNEPSLSKIKFASIDKLMYPDAVKLSPNIDLLWHTSQHFLNCKRPNWSGFMQTFSNGEHPGASLITLLPIINLQPSDETCIYSTLLYCIDLCEKYNLGTPCITFDQPLWIKSVEITAEKSLDILCRLGGFHTMMSFLGSVGTLMKGSGLSECLQEIYGENAVTHIESGKAVSRALRGHSLLQSALYSLILDELFDQRCLGEELESHEIKITEEEKNRLKSLYENLQTKRCDTIKEIEESAVLKKLSSAINQKLEKITRSSRTAKLWVQYIKYINIVKLFITSERTGNWHLHLEAVYMMLNLFAATGHINYAKSARLYLQNMLDLLTTHPEIYIAFTEDQYHTIRKSERFWAGLWTDLIIEQSMMRTLKSRGGLTRGRGMSEAVNLTWIHSMHACAGVHSAMTNLTMNQHKTSDQHVDLGNSRINRDNEDLKKLKVWLNTNNPFNKDEKSLKSIST